MIVEFGTNGQNPMRCHQARENLELLVLGELGGAERAEVEAHLARCPECRAAAEACRLLVRQIKPAAQTGAPRPDFERAVRSAVAAEIGAERRRRRVRRAVAAAGALAAVLVLVPAIRGAWQGLESGPGPAAVNTAQAPDADVAPERWRFTGASAAPASVADGLVVRGNSMYLLGSERASAVSSAEPAGAYVVAIDSATGRPRWRSGFQSLGYLAADRHRVYCLSPAGPQRLQLVALDAADGKTLWRYSQDSPRRLHSPCRPVPLRGGRVCWTHHNTIHVLNAETGEPTWTRALPGEGRISCAVGEADLLYVVTGRALHCLKSDSGDECWTEAFDQALSGWDRPLLGLAGRRVYFVQSRAARGARLFCADLDTRRLVWDRPIAPARCLLATPEAVYLRAERVLALDSRTGRPMWTCPAAGCGPLTLIDGRIHFVDSSDRGRLVALDRRTGQKAWELPGILSCDAFTKVGDTGYIKTQDGIVHAIAFRGPDRS